MIIKIINTDKKELIDSIWEINGNKAKCINSNNSLYIPGFIINIEKLGNYKFIELNNLND